MTLNTDQPEPTADEITAMREWLADCDFKDIDTDEALDPDLVTDAEVLDAVEQHYGGGLVAFLAAHRASRAVTA
jgi:hypothetical protein